MYSKINIFDRFSLKSLIHKQKLLITYNILRKLSLIILETRYNMVMLLIWGKLKFASCKI